VAEIFGDKPVMAVRVKICGINSVEAANAVVEARADFGGLVFFPKSPRHVAFDQARNLATILRGKVQIVTLMVDPDDSLIAQVMKEVSPDIIQLHGNETPARVAGVARMSGRPSMKAIAVTSPEDLRCAQTFNGAADYLLFDSRPGPAVERPGGVGLAFDWRILAGFRFDRIWGVAGGLNPENVARAIAIAKPDFVDASSGVEDAPGVKSRDRIVAFARAAHEVSFSAQALPT
jgi:phosphoribosylanthranilate isomerase